MRRRPADGSVVDPASNCQQVASCGCSRNSAELHSSVKSCFQFDRWPSGDCRTAHVMPIMIVGPGSAALLNLNERRTSFARFDEPTRRRIANVEQTLNSRPHKRLSYQNSQRSHSSTMPAGNSTLTSPILYAAPFEHRQGLERSLRAPK
jgi:hypothetical protein